MMMVTMTMLLMITMMMMNFSESRMTFGKLADLKLKEREKGNQFEADLESKSLFAGKGQDWWRR